MKIRFSPSSFSDTNAKKNTTHWVVFFLAFYKDQANVYRMVAEEDAASSGSCFLRG